MRKFLPIFLFFVTPLWSQPPEPVAILQVEPAYFSPDDDGYKDRVFFSPISFTDKEIDRWRLLIKNKSQKKIFRQDGKGFTALIAWDGLDKKGRVVKDGVYQAELELKGPGLRYKTESVFLTADTQAPRVTLSVSSDVLTYPERRGQSLEFIPSAEDENPIELWQAQIIDSTARTVFVEWSTGPVRHIFWDGRDGKTGLFAPKGVYRVAFQAWDRAGNISDPAFVDARVEVPAQEALLRALTQIEVLKTKRGLLVQLPYRTVFEKIDGKIQLSEKGMAMLSEAALLINAFPDAPVEIDGYFNLLGSSTRDRNRSSLLAWSSYSHLVKEGEVKASRLTVKGRGRTEPSERKGVLVDPEANGVEIFLLGDLDW